MRPRRRKIEAFLAGAALIMLSPLLATISIAIYLSDPGSVFYLAERAGLHGRRFRMYKFRTMYEGASGTRIAAPGDARIFPLGRLLRRLRLDELPQLINIIRGEMAFVGPRPEDPWIVEQYYTAADIETLNVLPGLTSPGTLDYCTHAEQSLNGDDAEAEYTAGPMRRKLELDRAYTGRTSPSGDFRIIALTLCLLTNVVTHRAGRKPRGSAEARAHQLGFSGDPEQ